MFALIQFLNSILINESIPIVASGAVRSTSSSSCIKKPNSVLPIACASNSADSGSFSSVELLTMSLRKAVSAPLPESATAVSCRSRLR
ncbi:hypothetical protein HBI56_068170 [Parastagonospora nodorum]|nr:hypothetical protein HBH56_002670 [Parastagonospora nodorum]KAH3938187.1 hypothetical protein HBH54_002670 [Parastagonospora nodorum]KAH3974979.1 hypothetical protein HBH51_085440 [Parastagonospora nodorum]KAH4052919.1 hypothetical protein HBH49_092480 [Parastagonospora nodorum]KAH4122363.1 hypothetical protein HBH47_088270 [Parastagonospora nodorum]